jgi:Protein of unknown function (DUF3102)
MSNAFAWDGAMNKVDLFTDSDVKLAEHAEVIRALGKRAVHDIIEIGRRLIEAKQIAGHGNWLPWLEHEFGWGVDTAQNFMNVASAAGKFGKFPNLNLPISGLYLLASPRTPTEVIVAVAERSEQGERLSLDEVKQMIAEAEAKGADAAESARADERVKVETRLAKLTAEYDAQIAALRDDAAREQVSLAEIEVIVERAAAPLKERIKKLKEKLDRKTPPTIPNPFGMPAARVENALAMLADAVERLTPQEKIEAEKVVEKTTGQPIRAGLADEILHSQAISKWIAGFLEEVERLP